MPNATTKKRQSLDITDYAWNQMTANAEQTANLRANASSLPEGSWQEIQDTVFETQDTVLKIVDALRGAGLVAPHSIYNKEIGWNMRDTEGEATTAMDAETEDAESSAAYGRQVVPLPLHYDEFSMGMRDQPAPGEGVDDHSVDQLGADTTSRNVNERLEEVVFNGWDVTIQSDRFGTNTVYGLTNFPFVNTGNLGDWQADASEARSDVRAMIQALKDDDYRPGNVGYWLYISDSRENVLQDYDIRGDDAATIEERLLDLPSISRVATTEFIDSGAVLFRPTRDVIDLAVGQELGGSANDILQTIEWESDKSTRNSIRVMGAMVPRLKARIDERCGIAYFN